MTPEEPPREHPKRDPVLVGIGITVTAVWVLNVLARFVPALGYEPDPLIHGIFAFVVGGIWRLASPSSFMRGGGDRDA